MKALILSNVNVAPLPRLFEELEAEVCGYDDVMLQLLDPTSEAHTDRFEIVIAHVDGEIFLGLGRDPDEYLEALRGFCERSPRKLVVVSSFCTAPETVATYAALWREPGSKRAEEARANTRLVDLAHGLDNLLVLDLELLYRRFGYAALSSSSFWYLGRVPYTQKMLRELARQIEQLVRAYQGRTRKALVLDLDGTLWGGVLGEDGVDGIELSEDGRGKVYRDFQQQIKKLRERGVLLALCSKNDPDEVEVVLREHPMMVLRSADFTARRVGWGDKPESIREIADELGLGLESLVFIDDSAAERGWVSGQLPELAVPEFPSRAEELPGWFLREVVYPLFPVYRLTAEDRARPERYVARRQRREAGRSLSRGEFLESLKIRIRFDLDPAKHLERAAQLTQRTNQFNTTSHRYTRAELRTILDDPSWSVVLVEYEDRFGKEGLIGLAIVQLETGEIDSFLLSCRVIGRGVETRLLEEVERRLRGAQSRVARGRIVPTARNVPVRDLYARHGYRLEREEAGGTRVFRKELGP
ncbi:MAG: HAD-IIIC family phosphatase [Myxococcota bacterium]